MKVLVIFDVKGQCPVYSSVTPNKDVFIRELSLAVKNDNNLIYGLYPEDYSLYEFSISPSGSSVSHSVIPFTDFIKVPSSKEKTLATKVSSSKKKTLATKEASSNG